MTIASEITRINTNIANAYTACNGKGATMPATQNSANLATCISSISGGGGGNRKIAPYNCTIEYFDDLSMAKSTSYPSAYNDKMTTSGTFTFNLSDMIPVYKIVNTTYQNTYLYPNYDGVSYPYMAVNLLTSEQVQAGIITQFYSNPADCPAVLNFGAITELNAQNACQNATNLQKVLMPNVTKLNLRACFKGCTSLTTVDMSKVSDLTTSNALAGSASVGGAFTNCTSLQTLSFPALTSTSFGSYTNQFTNMLKGVTGCKVHFPSNLQSVIGSWSSVTGGFGGTNTTVLWDLPATT